MSQDKFEWSYFNGHDNDHKWMICFFTVRSQDKSGLFIHHLEIKDNIVSKYTYMSKSCLEMLASIHDGKDRYSKRYRNYLIDMYSSSQEIRDNNFIISDSIIEGWNYKLDKSDKIINISTPYSNYVYEITSIHHSIDNEKQLLNVNEYYTCPSCKVNETGIGWYDYETSNIGSSILSTGWTWLSLHIDGKNYCYYETNSNSTCKYYSDTVEEIDGKLSVTDSYYNVMSYLSYPKDMTLTIQGIDYHIKVNYSNSIISSIAVMDSYYEGPITIFQGSNQVGVGFLEYLPSKEEPNPDARSFFGSFPLYIQDQIRKVHNDSLYSFSYKNYEITSDSLKVVSNPLLYTTDLIGGCWRSALISLCCGMITDNYEAVRIVESLQPYVEISQAASLIIDDIQDKSVVRRGKPCAYSIYGENICYLSGEITNFHYLNVINNLNLSEDKKLLLINKILSTIKLLHLGQIWDCDSSSLKQLVKNQNFDLLITSINKINCMKTAVSAAMVFELGAIVGSWYNSNIDSSTIKYFHDLGMAIGLIYQTLNDLEDIAKKQGDDLKDNKFTLPMILTVINEDNVDTKSYICELLANDNKSPEIITELLNYFRSHNVNQLTYSYINDIFKEDWDNFDKVIPGSIQKLQLRVFCDILLEMRN